MSEDRDNLGDDGDDDGPQRRAELAWAAISQLLKSIEAARLDLPDPTLLDTALLEMLAQHKGHLMNHIKTQTDVDPYKVVCWFGCSILEKVSLIKENGASSGRCPAKAVAYAMIRTLEGFLYSDSKKQLKLSTNCKKLLLQMLLEEKATNHDHGIWQNGLYAAFHVVVDTTRGMTCAVSTPE